MLFVVTRSLTIVQLPQPQKSVIHSMECIVVLLKTLRRDTFSGLMSVLSIPFGNSRSLWDGWYWHPLDTVIWKHNVPVFFSHSTQPQSHFTQTLPAMSLQRVDMKTSDDMSNDGITVMPLPHRRQGLVTANTAMKLHWLLCSLVILNMFDQCCPFQSGWPWRWYLMPLAQSMFKHRLKPQWQLWNQTERLLIELDCWASAPDRKPPAQDTTTVGIGVCVWARTHVLFEVSTTSQIASAV